MRIRFGKFVNKTLNIKIFFRFYVLDVFRVRLFRGMSTWTFSEYVYLEVQIYLCNQRSQPKKSCIPKPSIHMSNQICRSIAQKKWLSYIMG